MRYSGQAAHCGSMYRLSANCHYNVPIKAFTSRAAPVLVRSAQGLHRHFGPSGCVAASPHTASMGSGSISRRRFHVVPHTSSASAEAASTSTPQAVAPLYVGKKAVVVGAGPAGSTAAMFLARQGFSVDVYERRPEPCHDAVDTGRAYIIIVIPRGQAALQELGVPLPSQQEYVTKGTVRHPKSGKIGISREEGNVTFSRSGLAQYLIDQAKALYPNSIRFHFQAACDGVDVDGRKVQFTLADGSSVREGYDLLVGADGVGSAVRGALQQYYRDMIVVVTDSGREYKTYRGLQGDIEPEEFKVNPGATLHLWTTDTDAWTTLTAHSNPDGTYSGTMSLKTGEHATLTNKEQVEQLLKDKFTGVPEHWIPSIADQVLKEAPSPAGKRIKCSRLDGPGILLLGDAAHAVTPVFGQGANSSLESAKVLGDVLVEAGGDVQQVPSRFTATRLADVHALNELDEKAYSFFRRKGPFDPDFLQLLSHVLLGTILSKIVPFIYGSKPALLKLGSTTRYSEITAAVRRDSMLAAVGFAALGLWLSFKVAAKVLAGA